MSMAILTNALDQFITSYQSQQGSFPNLNLVADNSNINNLGVIFTQQDVAQAGYSLALKYPNTYSWQEWYDALWHHFYETTIPGVSHNPPASLEFLVEELPPTEKESNTIWLIAAAILIWILAKKGKPGIERKE